MLVEDPLLVVQIGSLGGYNVRNLLDHYDIMQNHEYIFFDNFGDALFREVKSGKSQLIFISHDDSFDSIEAAQKIKAQNPSAIIFGFSDKKVDLGRKCPLDGMIVTSTMNESDPSELAHAFIEKLSRLELIEVAESFGEPNEGTGNN